LHRQQSFSSFIKLKTQNRVFLIENYNGNEIRNANKPVNHQFNKIKEHSFYLFDLVSHLRSPYRGETPEIIERNDDPLHEFNELFGKQFVNWGGFPQQDFKKESNSAINVTTEE
jgi:hypothetical protein